MGRHQHANTQYTLILATFLLAGCMSYSGHVSYCPGPVPVPAPLPRVRTPNQIAESLDEVELARRAERARGNACAAAVRELKGQTP